ncbi:MAG TPA: tetratricopeptide repeat protein, partial [Gemmataceae bacterium]|nr:tetratricopeptide repeat protein [Gemmataceae bacterium]
VLATLATLAAGAVLVWREKDQKEAALLRAEAKEQQARRAVDDSMRVTEELLAAQPRMTEAAREHLERFLAFYEDLSRERGADPGVRFRTAQALHFVAHIRDRLGHPAEAEQAYLRQIALLTDLAAEFPGERKYRFDLFHSQLLLGDLLVNRNPKKADEAHRTAAELIAGLARDFPDEPNYRDAQAAVTVHLGVTCSRRGDYAEAERLLREALRAAEQLNREIPNKPTGPFYLANAARSLDALGNLNLATDRVGQAEESYRRALAVWEDLAAAHPQAPEEPAFREYALGTRLRLGTLFLDRGQFLVAQEWYEQCLPAARRLAQEYPQLAGNRSFIGIIHDQLAYCFQGTGRPNEAREEFERYVKVTEEVIAEFKDNHSLKWQLVDQLCLFPLARSRLPDRALALAREAAASPSPRGLGLVYYRAGRWAECVRELEEETRARPDDNAAAWFVLAMSHWQNGNKERALQVYRESVTRMDAHTFTHYPDRCVRAEAAELLGVEEPR